MRILGGQARGRSGAVEETGSSVISIETGCDFRIGWFRVVQRDMREVFKYSFIFRIAR
jgi:hypothetical protein